MQNTFICYNLTGVKEQEGFYYTDKTDNIFLYSYNRLMIITVITITTIIINIINLNSMFYYLYSWNITVAHGTTIFEYSFLLVSLSTCSLV